MTELITQVEVLNQLPHPLTSYVNAGLDALRFLDYDSAKLIINRLKDCEPIQPSTTEKDVLAIYGCGGIGSYIASSLPVHFQKYNINLLDFDNIESRNLARQRFESGSIGTRKSDALSSLLIRHGFVSDPDMSRYYFDSKIKILATDSAISRLFIVMNCKADWYIHTANTKTCSTTITINGNNKLELFGYIVYLLGLHRQDLAEQSRGTENSCAAQPLETQTAMANFNAATNAIKLINYLPMLSTIIFPNLYGFINEDWPSGELIRETIGYVSKTLSEVGKSGQEVMAGPMLENLKNSILSI